MEFTVYQLPEIYGNDGQLIRQGAFGPNTPFYDPNGRGMYDYLVNNLEALQNGVGGAALSASTATAKANEATAKANEAATKATAAAASASAAAASATAAAASAAAAQTAAGQAAAITTPDGLAARVLTLENLGFSIVNGVVCQTYTE